MKLSKEATLYLMGLGVFGVALVVPQNDLQAFLYTAATLLSGYHVGVEGIEDTFKQSRAAHKFVPNIHVLMLLAAAGSILIGNFQDAALLILIFAGAHFLEEYAESKSRREITALLAMAPVEARRYKADGSIEVVPVEQLRVGDKLQILNGAQVPIDGKITRGTASIDESAVSGESIPREKRAGDEIFGSTINGNSTFDMTVTKVSGDTVFAKIIQMVKTAQDTPTRTASLIQRFEPIYVKLVLTLLPAVLLAGPTLFGWDWGTSLYRTLGFLVAASPCALAASAVPATLSGISTLARNGVLFKGGSYLANLKQLKAVAFDKTGTLTVGHPEVTDVEFTQGVDESSVMGVVVAMEKQSNHPLAAAIVAHYPDSPELALDVQNELGKGVTAVYTGHRYVVGKPETFTSVPVAMQMRVAQLGIQGKTVVLIAVDNAVVGLLAMMDQPKTSAKSAIDYLRTQGITPVMITGDSTQTGKAVGKQLGIQSVYTNVLPAQKATVVHELQSNFTPMAMVGDGVNDAPALANAEVGIAMGSGTDVAIDVADVVLVENDLGKLAFAHKVSRRMDRIVRENIIFAMAVVALLTVLNFLQLTNISLGVVLHEGSTLVVILNSLRLLLVRQR